MAEQAKTMGEPCREYGGSNFSWATREKERTQLWAARHNAAYAAKQLRPGAQFHATDICAPISALADCIVATLDDVDESGLIAPLFGHVGDGNFHLVIMVDRDNAEEIAHLEAFNERLVQRALAADGTCTGEHGIGVGKRQYLAPEHGEGVATMRTIKQALNPKGIMNPGKLL